MENRRLLFLNIKLKAIPTHKSYIITPEEKSNIFPHKAVNQTPDSNSVTTQKTTIKSLANQSTQTQHPNIIVR